MSGATPTGAAALRAVVIDGNDAECTATMALCRSVGLGVNGWAASGASGLELIESLPAPPDVVVLDLHLPDMDGADLLLALSMLTPRASIVICSHACARIQDAALTLAATLGLTALAALPKPATDAGGAAQDGPSAAACEHARPARHAAQAATLAAALDEAFESRRLARCGKPPRRSAPGRPPGAGSTPALPTVDAALLIAGVRQRQFELYYQPKVAVCGGSLRGVEALLRWRLPGCGLLTPGCFLPQAEAAGMMDMLTMEVVRLALRDWQHWSRAGLMLPMSLNLSPLSLSDPHLASQLIAAVAAACVPPSFITFEIIEHAEIADLATALRVLIKLRLHGFGLSLDDFGAGHASMLQLSRFPFNELKVDRRLVHGAARRAHVRPLLRNAFVTARELDVVSVAEGVESANDLALLQELGCDLAQGYLIARPMRAAELPAWHAERLHRRTEPLEPAAAPGATVVPLRRRPGLYPGA